MSATSTATNDERGISRAPVRSGPGTPRSLDFLFASGDLLPTQLASQTNWTAEKKLAAAVLESALTEIRNHRGETRHRRSVKDAVAWVKSDDSTWPYSFRPLCELFGLDVEWVRARVEIWSTQTTTEPVSRVRYRHAA
jgi:hypothetical protein